jgi:uncharacterized protein YecE (DUF72 family)
LSGPAEDLERFFGQVGALGRKLGMVLVQLPPGLAYDEVRARAFFTRLRSFYRGGVACEPRHPSWFGDRAEELLGQFRVARVAVDPASPAAAALPGGWREVVYFRLHGSPKRYYSSYPDGKLRELALAFKESRQKKDVWCIFNNTAAGAAIQNALHLRELLHSYLDR